MKHRRLKLLTAMWLILTLLTAALWISSFYTSPYIRADLRSRQNLETGVIAFNSENGVFTFSLFRLHDPAVFPHLKRFRWTNRSAFSGGQPVEIPWFGSIEQSETSAWFAVAIPPQTVTPDNAYYLRKVHLFRINSLYWIPTTILFGMFIVGVHRLQRGRKRELVGCCPRCGYDLRATPDRCPECGAIATAA